MSSALLAFPVIDGYAALRRRMERWQDESSESRAMARIWPEIIGTLHLLQARLPSAEWAALRGQLRGSELASLVLEDPMTRWSWERPRGQRADAGLIDMVYGHASQAPRIAAASRLGRQMHRAVFALPSLAAMRARVAGFRRLIEQSLARQGETQVLSIGAGHLRSAEGWEPNQLPTRWVATEQDRLAIPVLAGQEGIEAEHLSIGGFIRRPARLGRFDLVTCGGVTDLMNERDAARLVAAGYAALRPGGRVVFASTARPLPDRAYLDVFMDWHPGWRDEAAVDRLLAATPSLGGARGRHRRKAQGDLLFTEVTKPARSTQPRRRAA